MKNSYTEKKSVTRTCFTCAYKLNCHIHNHYFLWTSLHKNKQPWKAILKYSVWSGSNCSVIPKIIHSTANSGYKRWKVHIRPFLPTAQSVFMRQGALWMLISYSIRDKTALNVLIYLQAPPDSLSSCLTDALANTFAARTGGRQLVGGVVMFRCGVSVCV